MDQTTLVESDIENGKEIVSILEKANFPIHNALWLYSSDEYAQWRLVIASRLYDEEGPLSAYQKLNNILSENSAKWILWSQRIQLVSPEDAVIKSLPPEGSIINPQFSGATGCNTYIESAYLYPIQKIDA